MSKESPTREAFQLLQQARDGLDEALRDAYTEDWKVAAQDAVDLVGEALNKLNESFP